MKEENKKKSVSKVTKKSTTASKKTETSKAKGIKDESKKTSPKKKSPAKKTTSKTQESIIEEKNLETKKVLEKMEIPGLIKEEEIVLKTPNKNQFTKGQENTIFALRIVTVVLATVLILVTSVKMFIEVRDNNYSERWVNKSYLTEKNYAQSLTCEDLANIVNGEDKFVFVTNFSEEEFELEKDLAKLIKEYHLENKFYVYNLESSCTVKATLDLQVENFAKIPTIYYYRNGLLNYKVEREDQKMIESADFQKLLDIYGFKKGE